MASTIKLIVFAIASSLVYGGTLSEIINYSSDTSLGEVFALGARGVWLSCARGVHSVTLSAAIKEMQ